MRKVLGAVAIVMLSALAANASTISGKLISTQDGVDPTIWHVGVWVNLGATTSDPTDGGISGVQFDILSDGTGKSASVAAAPSGPNFGKSKITWAPALSTGFTLVTPAKRDAVPADNSSNNKYNGDGDLDAVFGSFFDTGNFANTVIGKDQYALLATEDWTIPVNQGDHLSLVLIAPTYYDFTATGSNFQRSVTAAPVIDNSGTNGNIGVVPEPASIALLGMGVVGLVAVARRRRS